MKTARDTARTLVPGMEPDSLWQDGVSPEICAALARVPRYQYLPDDQFMLAGLDQDAPLGRGRRSAAPSTLGRIFSRAQVRKGARVMAIGIELGYPVALLQCIGAEVTAIESDESLRANAASRLRTDVRSAIPSSDAARGERWDAILFLGSVPALPREIVTMLTPEGRLIVPVRQQPRTELVQVIRGHRGHQRQDLGPVDIARLPPALNG